MSLKFFSTWIWKCLFQKLVQFLNYIVCFVPKHLYCWLFFICGSTYWFWNTRHLSHPSTLCFLFACFHQIQKQFIGATDFIVHCYVILLLVGQPTFIGSFPKQSTRLFCSHILYLYNVWLYNLDKYNWKNKFENKHNQLLEVIQLLVGADVQVDHSGLNRWPATGAPCGMGFTQNTACCGRPTSLVLPTRVTLPYQGHTLWKGLWVVAAWAHAAAFFQKALEEDQMTSEGDRVAYRWRRTSACIRPFIDLLPTQSQRKPMLVYSLASHTHRLVQ